MASFQCVDTVHQDRGAIMDTLIYIVSHGFPYDTEHSTQCDDNRDLSIACTFWPNRAAKLELMGAPKISNTTLEPRDTRCAKSYRPSPALSNLSCSFDRLSLRRVQKEPSAQQ